MKNVFNSLIFLLLSILSFNTASAYDLSGTVLYQGDATRPINNVSVALKNIGNNSIQTFTTGGNGFYQFTNVPNGSYILSGTTSLPGGGVTLYDAALVFLHMLGYYQYTPLQFLASDVDGSGTITWTDYNMIIYHILVGTPFPVGPWRFETSVFAITNLKDGVPHGLSGTCSGDIGGTFVPTTNTTPALPLAQEGILNITTGKPFTTNILTQDELLITGAGLIINFPSELLQVESVEFKGVDFQYNIKDGQIRLIWGNPNTTPLHFKEGESFVTIHGLSTSSFSQGMKAGLSLDGDCSILNTSNQEMTNLHFASPVIEYGNPSLKISNFPNPFSNSTKISISTPVQGTATIEIFAASGQLVKSLSVGNMDSGYHEVNIDASTMAQGYYLCKTSIDTGTTIISNTIRILKSR
ncbi:MAG: carboxypeptidase regulatory-like domain-containing protein [Bacteroidota bacterium]